MNQKKFIVLLFILLVACTETVTSSISLDRDKAVVGIPIKVNVKVSNTSVKPVFSVKDSAFGDIDQAGNFMPKKAGKATILIEVNKIMQSYTIEIVEKSAMALPDVFV